jgi:hypothetical protein
MELMDHEDWRRFWFSYDRDPRFNGFLYNLELTDGWKG